MALEGRAGMLPCAIANLHASARQVQIIAFHARQIRHETAANTDVVLPKII